MAGVYKAYSTYAKKGSARVRVDGGLPQLSSGSRWMFFHGIFLSENNRASIGIKEDAVVPAMLEGFRRHYRNGPSDLEERPGSETEGVVAAVDEGALLQLERIEGSPDFYRREAVPLIVAGLEKGAAEFYIMNRGGRSQRRRRS